MNKPTRDTKGIYLLVFLDASKVFDRMEHEGQVKKMNKIDSLLLMV